MRLAFTSDLHTDSHASNRHVWQEMVAILENEQPDVFICCGDVSAGAQQFALTLFALDRLSCPKLLIPGNHDVWIQNREWLRRGITSWQKYDKLLPALCRETGFHPLWVEPYVVGDVAFCGSMGWYDYSLRNQAFDDQVSRQDYHRKRFQGQWWNDGRFVYWPVQEPGANLKRMDDLAFTRFMALELTRQLERAQQMASRIVAVTHMLPFRAMMYYHHDVRRDYFGAFMGSTMLGDVLQSVPEVELVLSGHTHRKFTMQIGQIAVRTSPVGYARQWKGHTPLAVARERLTILDLPSSSMRPMFHR